MRHFKKFIVPTLGFLFLIIGCFLLTGQKQFQEVYVEPDQTQVYKEEIIAKNDKKTNVVSGEGRPTFIEVLDVGISLPIQDGYYNRNTQQWTLSKSSAHYAVMTPKPNNKSGNTFIYGHNRENVFSRLMGVKEGSIVFVTTDRNEIFIYKLKYSYTTEPTDSGFLYHDSSPQLTIQTCSGANFEDRTLFIYEFVGVTNA